MMTVYEIILFILHTIIISVMWYKIGKKDGKKERIK